MFVERSEATEEAFSALARARAYRASTTRPDRQTRLQEHLERSAEVYADRVISWFAIAHGISVAEGYDVFRRAILEYELAR